jgi:hypothetical protein
MKSVKKELWLSLEELQAHIDSMNARAEKEYHERFETQLRGHVEAALSKGKSKH